MKNEYICMLKDACKETNIAASNIRLKILFVFLTKIHKETVLTVFVLHLEER